MSLLTTAPAPPATSVAAKWIRAGLFALPAYGLLTMIASLNPQPDPAVDYAAWARFVTTDSYLWGHLLGSTAGLILAVFGTFALGAHLARGRSPRLALTAMLVAALGQLLFLHLMALSTFAAPETARAHLAGIDNISELQADPTIDAVVGLLFAVVIAFSFLGNVGLGIAMWRSRVVPRPTGALWVISAALLYALGLIVGALFTHGTPPTAPLGALLVAVAGGWVAVAAVRSSRSHA